jgi:PHD/YefM family antitoxin component YafN of YafNO toxin-antitoxin module
MLDRLGAINENIRKGYTDNKPLFIAKPNKSTFKIMTETDYQACSTREILQTLRNNHIVVNYKDTSAHEFDERALRTLRPLNEPVTIHGKSQTPFVKR